MLPPPLNFAINGFAPLHFCFLHLHFKICTLPSIKQLSLNVVVIYSFFVQGYSSCCLQVYGTIGVRSVETRISKRKRYRNKKKELHKLSVSSKHMENLLEQNLCNRWKRRQDNSKVIEQLEQSEAVMMSQQQKLDWKKKKGYSEFPEATTRTTYSRSGAEVHYIVCQ